MQRLAHEASRFSITETSFGVENRFVDIVINVLSERSFFVRAMYNRCRNGLLVDSLETTAVSGNTSRMHVVPTPE